MTAPLSGMTPEELSALLEIKPFQGKQLFQWIHGKRVFDFGEMSDLSKDLRARLEDAYAASSVQLLETQQSAASGTKKVLLSLSGGETVESVLLRDRNRITLCVSSQAGCPLQCSFCATGMAGLRRNLEPGEIVEQVLYLLKDEKLAERTPNIVYMGMGEPFCNYDAVIRSIRLLMHPEGLGIGARKITVSTVGRVEEIERFAGEGWQVRLSVSLHAANDTLRSELVPLNRRYPLSRLREALERYQARTGRQFSIEGTLLEGANDRDSDARELAAYLEGLDASVNLIPWNPVEGLPYTPAPRARCEAFRARLEALGVTATLRRERGQDIDAACGQLRRVHACG